MAEDAARAWVEQFGGRLAGIESQGARRWFDGNALVRVRATVAHDSYERLVEVRCAPRGNTAPAFDSKALSPLPRVIETILPALGISPAQVIEAAEQDPATAEFSRFYLERRAQEMQAAGGDERKRKKMEDDFTPRLSFALVGAEGGVLRDVQV